jgi:hypothetical protein
MGSRAKLADIPKVHQMIEERIRASIATRFAEYRIMLPGVDINTGRAGMANQLPPGMSRRTVDVLVED